MEVAASIARRINGCMFDAAGRRLGYLLHYNDNIETLKNQAATLADMRDRIQADIDIAKRNIEHILVDVQNWMTKANDVFGEAEKFFEQEFKANKRCLRGWCINLKQRYQFSKYAKEKTLAIYQLLQDGKFDNVSHPAPPPGIVSSYMGVSNNLQSRQSIMNKIMVALNDENVHIIGVCGMGGVGKTTLVKEIAKIAKEAKLYDAVVMAIISRTPSILRIQGQIADMLGLELLADSELTRAGFLWERIKREKRLLLILDDIWRRIELDMIGIPFGKDHGGCKVILTSRRRDVCNQMDCQKIFVVESLSKQESWVLFKELIGSDAENSDISPIARDIAANCGGLPIAVVTLARELKNYTKYVWLDAAEQLQKSKPSKIWGMYQYVIPSLELSYDYLESEEAKSFFLFCSLFPKDFKIPVEVIMRYGMGLRWFKNVDTIEAARYRAHAVVSTLVSSFLLIHHKEKDDDEEYVKMNSMVRDVAHVIAFKCEKLFMVKAGFSLQEWPSIDLLEDLTTISLMSNDIKVVPEGLECPKLQALLLQKNSELVLPTTFFQEMRDLKVLDLSETKLLPLPGSFSRLANLRTLCLNDCKLGDLSIIGQLCKLEILNLHGSSIEEIPICFSQLSHLRLLDLSWCINLKLIPHSVIPCLHKLEELYLEKSFKHWDFERKGDLRSNARLVDLQALSRLTTLHIYIPNPDLLSNDIFCQSLTNFVFEIGHENGKEWHTRGYSRSMSFIEIRISENLDCFKTLLRRTQNLFLGKISGSENVLHDLAKEELTELKSLTVDSCEELTKVCLPTLLQSLISLEKIEINDCNNLQKIFGKKEEKGIVEWKKDDIIISPSLGNLTFIIINCCDKLKNLFTPSIAKSLVKLRTLAIWECATIQEIVTNKEEEKGASTEKIVFPTLNQMKLVSLDSLICFGSGLYTIEFPALEKLEIRGCPKLKTFGYKDQVTPKLNEVCIEGEYRWNGNLNATVQLVFNEQGKVFRK